MFEKMKEIFKTKEEKIQDVRDVRDVRRISRSSAKFPERSCGWLAPGSRQARAGSRRWRHRSARSDEALTTQLTSLSPLVRLSPAPRCNQGERVLKCFHGGSLKRFLGVCVCVCVCVQSGVEWIFNKALQRRLPV